MALSQVLEEEIKLLELKIKKYKKAIECIEDNKDTLQVTLEESLDILDVVYRDLTDYSSDYSKGSMRDYFLETSKAKKFEYENMKDKLVCASEEVESRLAKAQTVLEEIRALKKEKEAQYREALAQEILENLKRVVS